MARRRAAGEGSVYFHKASGRWCAELRLPPGPDGRPRRWTAYARTQREAVRRLQEARQALLTGRTLQADRLTVGVLLRRWLVLASPDLAPTTQRAYGYAVRRLEAVLGMLPLRRLSSLQIEQAYATLRAAGVSAATLTLLDRVLHRALDRAVDWGLLDRNPLDRVPRPRYRPPERPVWTLAQLRRFLQEARTDEDFPLYLLAIVATARLGELLGLTWDCVDWENATLTIRRQAIRLPGRGVVFRSLKGSQPLRVIRLPQAVLPILRGQQAAVWRQRERLGAHWQEHHLLFPGPFGAPRDARRVRERWARLLRRLGLPPLRLHDLRHLGASLLLGLGASVKEVQARLGHASARTTLDIYSHLIAEVHAQTSERLGELLGIAVSFPYDPAGAAGEP